MNTDQVLSLVRGVLLSLGTAITYHGAQVFTTDQWQVVVGGIVMAASVVWSQIFHRS